MGDIFRVLACELAAVSRQVGYDPDNENFVINYMIKMLEAGNLHLAQVACQNDSDKITNDELRRWIVENLYKDNDDHPWRLLWHLRESSKNDPDF